MPVHPLRVDGGHIAFKAALLGLVFAACGGGAASNRGSSERVDDTDVVATVLASRLPTGASVCAVAQPRWVAPSHRAWMLPLTSVDPLVWREQSAIEAYAEAQQRQRSGPGATVRLIRFKGELDALRTELSHNPRFDVRWDRAPSECRPDDCVVSARLIAPNVVRLDRGLWRQLPPGVEAQCAAIAREHPLAAEFSVRGPDEMALTGGMVPWVGSATWIEVGARVVRVVQRDRMDSVEAAEILAASGVDLLQGRLATLGHTERERSGSVVISRTELTWDDLRLGIDDRKRDAGNRRYIELLMSLESPDAVDPRQLTHALDQLRARIALLDHAPVSAAQVAATVALAERIQIANPADHDSAYLLAALYVRVTLEADKALPLIAQYASDDPRKERWIELGFQPTRSDSNPAPQQR